MKRFYVLTSFRGCVLSWLTTLSLDRGNGRSFDIYYHSFPMGTCLKYFINTYRCVCWIKSTSIDGPDVPFIRPCLVGVILKKKWLLLVINIGIIISVNAILKKINFIIIPIYLHSCNIPKGHSSNSSKISDYVNIVEITASQHYTTIV